MPANLCRKLEIAYLAESYLKSIAQERQGHAGFLLRTMGLALQARPRSLFVSSQEADTSAAGHRSDRQSKQIRWQLLAAMIAQFNSAGIRYCILSGYENHTATGESDVDLMVHPRDMRRIPALLAASARSTGGLLIQAIRHETTAWYFILARHDGQHTGFLDPDCCSDYLRNGRLWMPAREVIARRLPHQDFYVPSVADEFTYYLLKKVLKQSITADQLQRLRGLYSSEPAECQRRLARFWPQTTALAIQRALVQPDLGWFANRLPALLLELNRSTPVEHLFSRCVASLREFVRRLQRALFPTGMSVLVTGGESSLRSNVADDLLQNLAPAFRRTSKVSLTTGFQSALSVAARVFAARRRSTLIVGTDNSEQEASGLRLVRSKLKRLLFRPDVVLALQARSPLAVCEPGQRAGNDLAPLAWRARQVCLDANLSADQIVAAATRSIVDWLAARLERRLIKPSASAHLDVPVPCIAEPVELRPAGLD